MKNIHVLPTDKPTWLHKSLLSGVLRKSSSCIDDMKQAQGMNIYITSDEEIKFNDYITDGYLVWQWKDNSSLLGRKKIILTTDQDLIAEGIQQIDDKFLEWFVKNPSFEYVEVQDWVNYYKIFIPKEEPKIISDWLEQNRNPEIDKQVEKEAEQLSKQETLEETAFVAGEESFKEFRKGILEANRFDFVCGFTAGAKWQQEQYTIEEQHVGHTIDELDKEYIKGFNEGSAYYIERMYNEEEVIAFGEFIFKNTLLTHAKGVKNLFEQFKKK
jgi:hypothetical protein